MPEIGFGISSKGSLLEALSTIPSDYQAFLREGFSRLSTLDVHKRSALLAAVRDAAPYPSNIELEPITSMLGLETGEAAPLVSACRMLLGILSFRNDSPAEVVSAATAAKIMRAEDGAALTAFAEVVAHNRADLRKSLTTSSLQHVLLPSLARFDVKVDLRLEFTEGKLSGAAPVALVFIDTDSNDGELYFQMTRSQLVALESKLKKALEELGHAEEVAKKLT